MIKLNDWIIDSYDIANIKLDKVASQWFLDQSILSAHIANYLSQTKTKLYENPSKGIKLDRVMTNEQWIDTFIKKVRRKF